MGVMLGSMSIGYAAPQMQTLAIARGAAASVFKIIDLVSFILFFLLLMFVYCAVLKHESIHHSE